MEDVFHLDGILAIREIEIWTHLQSLGFQLQTVFYGAFMRLFAFMLPTASLFRLWDLLFYESTISDHKPRRHILLDFSYAAIRACKPTLIQCESAAEAHDCIVGYIESLFDPSAVVMMTMEAGHALWVETSRAYRSSPELENYDRYLNQFRSQNEALRDFLWTSAGGARPGQVPDQEPNTKLQDQRMTTRYMASFVVPALLNNLKGEQDTCDTYGGMFRQTPKAVLDDAPDEGTNFVHLIFSSISAPVARATRAMLHLHSDHHRSAALRIAPPPGTPGEPTACTRQDFGAAMMRAQLATNLNLMRIADAFESQDRRISLNEVLAAFICCSKGTVGEKAHALFQLYTSSLPPPKMHHVHPVTRHTAALVERVEDGDRQACVLHPPTQEQVARETALHFKIYTHSQGADVLLGETFVRTLKPYFWNGMPSSKRSEKFAIWGTKLRFPPGVQQAGPSTYRSRPYIGDINMSIIFMPASDGTPQVGQLGIRVFSILFDRNRMEAVHRKNPSVVVCTYDDSMHEKQIQRWDPRTNMRSIADMMTMAMTHSEAYAYGGDMGWDATMGRHNHGTGEHGWDENTGLWRWRESWGNQYSIENFHFRKDFCDVRQSTISLLACRTITQGILNRSLCMLTNRQAVLLSDHVFNRAGAVAAILDAVLVKGELGSLKHESIKQLRADTSFQRWKDVRHHILLNGERDVVANLGNLNLFRRRPRTGEDAAEPDASGESPAGLGALRIQDPWPGSEKVLWIRYARSGDGERGNRRIRVGGDGSLLDSPDVPLDMDLESQAAGQQMSITKDEFISCILASPLLSESLRQLSTSDVRYDSTLFKKPIKLVIAIGEPTRSDKGSHDCGELRIFFGDEDKENARAEGARHNVRVFIEDTIHQLVAKLKTACQQEADCCQEAEARRMRLQSVADCKLSGLAILVFVPDMEVRRLALQKRTATPEYARLYRLAEQNLSNWHPLAPLRTLNRYTALYGSDLRLVAYDIDISTRARPTEGGDGSKVRSDIIRQVQQFQDEQKSRGQSLTDTNTPQECYGYAAYKHSQDGGSSEWRPAVISSEPGLAYRAQYAYAVPASESGGDTRVEDLSVRVGELDVIFAPRSPALAASKSG
eukprot:NODE_92_length_3730_cov_8.224258.p1 GENE.NODE_92_length_3730_cov_8.224258~~NODE_92_length_3730_cov_8.224258.p1  ORF type:complete len:1121 (+),score=246.57 NODE_92_length_3730_cov_8.224258:36-3365(+)